MFTIYASACHEQHFNFQYQQSLRQTSKKSGCRTVSNNGSGSGLAPAQNILAFQVWFGFT